MPLGQGDVLASLLIGDRWGPGRWTGSQGGLVALGLKQGRSNWRMLSDDALDRAWLTAIQAGASSHLGMEIRLRAYARRAAEIIRRRRKPGHLKALLLYAMTRRHVASGQVAQAFGLTSAGAIKLLGIAASEGLLIERTGQSSYRSYMVPVSGALPQPIDRSEDDPFEPDYWEHDD